MSEEQALPQASRSRLGWIVGVGLLAVVGLAIASASILVGGLETARFWLDVLRVLLSWPVVLFVAFIVLLRRYTSEIREILTRRSVKFGTSGLEIGALIPSEASTPPQATDPALLESIQQRVEEALRSRPDPSGATVQVEAAMNELRAKLSDKEAEAKGWWLRYLAASLTQGEKNALQFLYGRPQGVTTFEFDQAFPQAGATLLSGRLSLAATLYPLGLVTLADDDNLYLTSAGREFVEYEAEEMRKRREEAKRFQRFFSGLAADKKFSEGLSGESR